MTMNQPVDTFRKKKGRYHDCDTDIKEWDKIGRAHGEVFGDVRPATSIVEVSRLIAPEMLVEIEAEAVVSE